MISVEVTRDSSGQVNGFRISGHALFDDKGRDIVCAAVSILAINTINSIERFLPEENMNVSSNEEKGFIECELKEPVSEKARLLLDTMVFGVENIEKTYGKKYVRIR